MSERRTEIDTETETVEESEVIATVPAVVKTTEVPDTGRPDENDPDGGRPATPPGREGEQPGNRPDEAPGQTKPDAEPRTDDDDDDDTESE